MKKIWICLYAMALVLSIVGTASASLTFIGGSGNLAASVDFMLSGNTLTVKLTNTSTADVMNPGEVLTAVFFHVNEGALTPVSATLAPASTVFYGPNGGGNVGGEWAYNSGLAGAPGGANSGISSSGLGLFGSSNFGGTNLQGPEAVDGGQYGITSAGDNLTTGNAKVTGDEALIQNSVIFTLTATNGFDLDDISKVSFQYGTALDKPNVPGNPVPIPGAVWLLGSSLIGLVGIRRRVQG